MASNPSLDRLAQDVSYLQTDMAKVGVLVDRLDVTIDKLTEVSTSISQLLAVHESKIATQDALVRNISDLVEKRRVEMDDNIKLLHGRISSGEKELETKIDDQYDHIMEELKQLRKESASHHDAFNERITVLEKWMWVAIGAFTVINSLIGNFDFTAFLG
jgi:hypothetical protein